VTVMPVGVTVSAMRASSEIAVVSLQSSLP